MTYLYVALHASADDVGEHVITLSNARDTIGIHTDAGYISFDWESAVRFRNSLTKGIELLEHELAKRDASAAAAKEQR
jgi:hypothetical protein